MQWSVVERSDHFQKDIIIGYVWFFSLLLILNTESWNQKFDFSLIKMPTSCEWPHFCSLPMYGYVPFCWKDWTISPTVCGFLCFRLFFRIGGQEQFFEGFFVFQICLTALMYDSLKILCQNYDKFIFCRWWKPDIRF